MIAARQYVEVHQTYTVCGHPRTVVMVPDQAVGQPPSVVGQCPNCRPLGSNVYSYGRNRSTWRVTR